MPIAQELQTSQQELLDRFASARTQTDNLFQILKAEVLYDRPIAERHRIIFYIGHLEAFDWNLLHDRLFNLKSFNPEYDHLFAFGIDPVDGGLPADQPSDWPSLENIRHYIRQIRSAIDQAITNSTYAESAPDRDSAYTLLNTAIEHRLMHAETLAYMLHQMPFDSKVSQPQKVHFEVSPLTPAMVEIPAGRATLGLARAAAAEFGWDNEYEEHAVPVPRFSIDKYQVTNGQYLEFVEAGGYEKKELWKDCDWQWRVDNDIHQPVFWSRAGNEWRCKTMFESVPLPLDWPVHVSHAEASAYARWAGKELPTEAQWHRAAYGTPQNSERIYPWGAASPDSAKGNFDFYSWNPAPVHAFSAGQSAFGVSGLLGNGWEWTSTVFAPFDGFKPFSFYPGYSANFFDGKHYVIKGGSARTAASMLRRSFRNWFQPHYQYVYAGFRCVSNKTR